MILIFVKLSKTKRVVHFERTFEVVVEVVVVVVAAVVAAVVVKVVVVDCNHLVIF